MNRSKTPSFVHRYRLHVGKQAERLLHAKFETGRRVYNALVAELLHRFDRLRSDPRYRTVNAAIAKTYRKEAPTGSYSGMTRTELFALRNDLREEFELRGPYSLAAFAGALNRNVPLWTKHEIGADTVHALAERAWSALNRYMELQDRGKAYVQKAQRISMSGKGRNGKPKFNEEDIAQRLTHWTSFARPRPHRRNDPLSSLSSRANKNQGYISWDGSAAHIGRNKKTERYNVTAKARIDPSDPVDQYAAQAPVKAVAIDRIDARTERWYVRLVLEGTPYPKLAPNHTQTGVFISTQRVSIVRNGTVSIKRFGSNAERSIRAMQTRRLGLLQELDRERRRANPKNYTANGVPVPGSLDSTGARKRWVKTPLYQTLLRELREIQRRTSGALKTGQGTTANDIIKDGSTLVLEDHDFRTNQRNVGKTTRLVAPGRFAQTLASKAQQYGSIQYVKSSYRALCLHCAAADGIKRHKRTWQCSVCTYRVPVPIETYRAVLLRYHDGTHVDVAEARAEMARLGFPA